MIITYAIVIHQYNFKRQFASIYHGHKINFIQLRLGCLLSDVKLCRVMLLFMFVSFLVCHFICTVSVTISLSLSLSFSFLGLVFSLSLILLYIELLLVKTRTPSEMQSACVCVCVCLSIKLLLVFIVWRSVMVMALCAEMARPKKKCILYCFFFIVAICNCYCMLYCVVDGT